MHHLFCLHGAPLRKTLELCRCRIPKCCGAFFFEYETPKVVSIQNVPLGILRVVLQGGAAEVAWKFSSNRPRKFNCDFAQQKVLCNSAHFGSLISLTFPVDPLCPLCSWSSSPSSTCASSGTRRATRSSPRSRAASPPNSRDSPGRQHLKYDITVEMLTCYMT